MEGLRMENISNLTDKELRDALLRYNQSPGPITDSTRNVYKKKLAALMETNLEDGDDTSDEDYVVQDDEETDDDDEELEEEEEGDDDDDDELMLGGDKSATDDDTGKDLKESKSPNRVSRFIKIVLVSFFALVLASYLTLPSQPFKSITKQLFIVLILSPFGYAIYRIISYYKQRRRSEMQRVCKIVEEVLELLQSPSNPNGMMPILHIRDTILTPAERKDVKMTKLWTKAVKFIEEHESRVKVELVNVDGEDFRAWKWIGSRKF